MPADSLKIVQPDTIRKQYILFSNPSNTFGQSNKHVVISQSIANNQTGNNLLISDTTVADTIPPKDTIKEAPLLKVFDLYPSLRESQDSAYVKYQSPKLVKLFTTAKTTYTGELGLGRNAGQEKGWVLGVTLTIVAILIFIRIYFQKYLSPIFKSMVNLHTSEKLMREKNVLIRRVFVLTNLIFLLSTSMFIFLCIQYFEIGLPIKSNFLIFILITVSLFLFLTIRLALQNAVGKLFEATVFFREYIHNTYIINKNLGLYTSPLIISIFYLNKPFSDILLFICGGIFAISLGYRYLKGVQIILKQNVFLLYSILYLCTLEILPALVGIKYVLMLR
jgi:hypothetical protein